jgi:O-antigen/teichoic acid export membrane protein
MYFTFIGAAITIVLNAILVPKYGYMGAAIATLACFVSMAVVNIIVGHKQYPIPYEWKKMGTIFSFTTVLAAFFWIFRSNNLFYSLLLGTLIIFTYLILLFFTDRSLFKMLRKQD